MDLVSKSTSNLNKRKSSKNKFTDLKNRITKKKEAELKRTGKLKPVSQETQQKMSFDKAKNLIDKELTNDGLMIKIIDNNTIYNSLDDYYYKCGDFDLKTEKDEELNNETERNINETHDGFFSKFKNFKKNCRKGLLKSMNLSKGFIKGSMEYMVVPNPIGLISKNRDPTILNLKEQNIGDDYIKCLSQGLGYANNINKIELSNNRLTFNGISPLIKSIEDNQYLKSGLKILDLSFNKIGDIGITNLCSYINNSECNLEDINLEGNSLGDENVNKLSKAINNSIAYKISSLNFSRNLISDDSCINISNLLTKCTTLRILMLSWNHIKNLGASMIINKLKTNREMRVFDISWNSIGTNLSIEPQMEDVVRGAKPERNFMNYEMNEFRTTMSLTFKKELFPIKEDQKKDKKKENNAGNHQTNSFPNAVSHKTITSFAKELGEYFKEKNTELVHLDISHNNINSDDAAFLAKECRNNHKILGIHVDGNEMNIDELGFIIPMKKTGKVPNFYANSQIYYNMNRDLNCVRSTNLKTKKIRAKNNCWICEGWREITFSYRPKDLKNVDKQFVKIHLSFENWKACDTMFSENCFKAIRMCPPGEVHYFFTVNKKPVEDYGENNLALKNTILYAFDDVFLAEFNENEIKNNYNKANNNNAKIDMINEDDENNMDLNMSNMSFRSNVTQVMGEEIKEENLEVLCGDKIRLKNLGRITVKLNPNVVNEEYQKLLKFCEARPERKLDNFTKPKTPWVFPISIWATLFDMRYDGEREETINDAFEHDFERCQMMVFIKNEEVVAELKEYLRKYYKIIVDCYKHLAALMGSSIWQIQETTLKDFFTACNNLVDLKIYNINGVLLQARAVKASQVDMQERMKNKNKNIPDNIIRHQFMSLLVRISKDKYVTQLNTYNNIIDAVKYTFDNHYINEMKGFPILSWKQEKYYCEHVDNFIKAHLPFLDAMYKSWAPKKDPGKRDTWMILEEFTLLMNTFVESDFPVREIPILVIFSMKLQVNEISSERHIQISFPEFLEAFCRVIDKANPLPPNEEINEWNKNMEQTMGQKLQNIVGKILKAITHPDFKIIREKLPLPVIEKETGLYIWDATSPFYTNLIAHSKNSWSKKN